MEKLNLPSSKITLRFLLLFCFSMSVLKSYAQPTVDFSAIITGLTNPIQIINAGDQSNRIFIVEKGGAIKIFEAPVAPATTWTAAGTLVTVTGLAAGNEQGLLSAAFHPQFKTNGLFFVYYNNTDGDLELARYNVSAANPNEADLGSKVVLKTISHPTYTNHNGGELHFGSDGFLYLSTGDGGSGNDPSNNAQNSSVLLGKILRFDVNSNVAPYYNLPSGNPFGNEVFALGLRNPFRWSFDRATGDMWIGDVGQSAWEEINHRTAATLAGANYGWRCYEGNDAHITGGCGDISQYHFPVYQYSTQTVGNSVIGGVVYRGLNSPGLQGYYIGADYSSGNIHVIGPVGGTVANTVQSSSFTHISDLGEAENGEIFAARLEEGIVYALSSDYVPLPVELVSFTGISGNEGVKLNWKTAVEKNFRQFDIEYSKNAKTFEKIGSVYPKGSLTGSDYQFFHALNGAQTVYYRLKMVDLDDTFKYSTIIGIESGNENVSTNFVRPSLIDSKTMHLLIEEPFNSFELVSTNGNVLMKRDITNERGDLDIPVESVSSGMYIVRLQGNERILNQKVLIVK